MVSKYSLAIHPDAFILSAMKQIKKRLKAEIGGHYGSASSLAHISLFGFHATEANYPKVLAELKKIIAGFTPFEIEFSGFAHFGKRVPYTFYARPKSGCAKTITDYGLGMTGGFKRMRRKGLLEGFKKAFGTAHMSVGRQLTKKQLELAYVLFNEFEHQFLCDSFVIRKFSEQTRQYQVIDTIPLLGHGYTVAIQLELF